MCAWVFVCLAEIRFRGEMLALPVARNSINFSLKVFFLFFVVVASGGEREIAFRRGDERNRVKRNSFFCVWYPVWGNKYHLSMVFFF